MEEIENGYIVSVVRGKKRPIDTAKRREKLVV
jgi:hypothetical protein